LHGSKIIFQARAKWEARFARLGRTPTQNERENFLLWEDMVESRKNDKFLGVEDHENH